jgi:hypothetical protein
LADEPVKFGPLPGLDAWTVEGFYNRMNDIGGFAVPARPAGITTWEGMNDTLRVLGGRIADARVARVSGKANDAELERRVKAALDVAENTILGRVPDMGPSAWNQPKQVGRYLKRTLGLDEPEEACVRRVLEAYFAELSGVIVDFEQDKLTEDDMHAAVDGLVETYAHHFLGIPLENEVE